MSPDQLNNTTPAITFTEEDRLIWRQIEWYSIGTDGMYAYRAAGRRDAELMLRLAWGFEHGSWMEGHDTQAQAWHMRSVWAWCAWGLPVAHKG